MSNVVSWHNAWHIVNIAPCVPQTFCIKKKDLLENHEVKNVSFYLMWNYEIQSVICQEETS